MRLGTSTPDQQDRRAATALLVAATFFMENLDATVIATSLPAMARDFGVAPAHLSVGISAYLLALTVFIPVSSWAADRFGARRVFATAVCVFTGASLLCALSTGLWSFTAARTLQGIGGAMMVPVGRLLVLRDLPKEGIVRAVALLTWPALAAPVLGPPLGGWISTHWSWHWIFLLNLPLGLAALAAALWLVREGPRPVGRFDARGFALSGLGLALCMAGLELAGRNDLPAWPGLAALAGGLVLLAAAARHLRRTPQPLFGLEVLAIPSFRATAVGGSLARMAIATAPFLLPLMFQVGFGWSAVQAGVLLLWLFAGNLCMKPGTTWVMRRFGFRRVLVGNGLLVTSGFAACALLQADTPQALVAALLFLTGMTRSMQFTALNTVGFADVPQPRMRDANTLFSVLQQMNAAMGVASGALALALAEALLGNAAGQPAAAEFQLALWFVAGLALLAVLDALRLPADAGRQLLGRA